MASQILNFEAEDLLEYKKDIIEILISQITILHQIETEVLEDEEDKQTENRNQKRVLSLDKSAEFRDILQGEVDKLKNFDVVLAVVGTMKAGKSTAINAMVGREILPNRNRPMTSIPTLICHNAKQQEPKLTFESRPINDFLESLRNVFNEDVGFDSKVPEIKELVKFVKSKKTFSNEYHDSENIFNFLQQLNDLVRLTTEVNHSLALLDKEPLVFPYESYRNIEQLPKIDIAFSSIKNDFDTQGRFILLDTPGPNEAGQKELKVMLKEQLERSSAVMLVLDYTQLNSEAEADVKEQISAIPTVQKSRLFAMVNKFDQKTANSDDERETIDHVYDSLLKDMVDKENIYPISAQDAYLANRMLSFIEHNGKKPDFHEETWIEDFAINAFGRKAEQKYSSADLNEVNEIIEELVLDSKMEKPLQNIVSNMHKNAPIIAIQSALVGSSKIFEDLHTFFGIRSLFSERKQFTDEELEKLELSIKEINIKVENLNVFKANILVKIQDSIMNTGMELDSLIAATAKEECNPIANEQFDCLLRALEVVHEEYTSEKSLLVKKELDGDSLIWTSKSMIEELIDVVAKNISRELLDADNVIEEEIKALKEIFLNDFLNEVNEINESIDATLDGIDDRFIKNKKKLKVDTEFLFDSMLLPIEIKSAFNIDPLKYSKEVNVFQNGITAPVKRLFGRLLSNNLGYQEKEMFFYKIGREEFVEDYVEYLNANLTRPMVNKLIGDMDCLFNEFSASVNSIIQFIEEVVKEMIFSISNEKEPDLERKMAYKNRLNLLNKSYEYNEQDWRKIASTFNVEAISNEESTK